MKEKIYTIPVMDAVRNNSECPFCEMYALLEKNAIEFVMGPSYMERDVRAETDKLGFCGEHLKIMAKSQNSLGVALMLQTHLMKVNKELHSASSGIGSITGAAKKGLFSKGETDNAPKNAMSSMIYSQRKKCYVCDKANNMFDLYIDTFFYLWAREEELRKLVTNGNGFCLSHFARLTDTGAKLLNTKDYKLFIDAVIPLQLKNLDRLEEEIDWFIKKFDYRFTDEPWKNSKDSVQRTITKLASIFVE